MPEIAVQRRRFAALGAGGLLGRPPEHRGRRSRGCPRLPEPPQAARVDRQAGGEDRSGDGHWVCPLPLRVPGFSRRSAGAAHKAWRIGAGSQNEKSAPKGRSIRSGRSGSIRTRRKLPRWRRAGIRWHTISSPSTSLSVFGHRRRAGQRTLPRSYFTGQVETIPASSVRIPA